MNSVDEMTMKTLHLIEQVMCDCRFIVLRNNNVSALKKGFKLEFSIDGILACQIKERERL